MTQTNSPSNKSAIEDKEPFAPPAPDYLVDGFVPLYILDSRYDDKFVSAMISSAVYPVCYFLGNLSTSVTTNSGSSTTTKIDTKTRLFRVTTNLAGYSITEVDKLDSFESVKSSAYFSLPKIPHQIIQDVDDFFRAVYQKHGTEAIVIFTYDEQFLGSENPSDGWGVIVPDQTNSAGSCDYDMTSAVMQLPDEEDHQVSMVGTAHSHPEMSAYCSGVDKKDQAHFDGIHITYGWKSAGAPTDYHIELQLAGTAWTLTPKQSFTTPERELSEKMSDDMKRVKKAFSSSYGFAGGSPMGKSMGTSSMLGGGINGFSSYSSSSSASKDFSQLPSHVPTPSIHNCIIHVGLVPESLMTHCPVCTSKVTATDVSMGQCLACKSYIVTPETGTISALKSYRSQKGRNTDELDASRRNFKSVFVWEQKIATENDSETTGTPVDRLTIYKAGTHDSSDPEEAKKRIASELEKRASAKKA